MFSGRTLGERMPLSDIQRLAKEDPQFLNMSEERKKELLDALTEHRKVSQQGLRASNVAASLDITATMDRMGHEVSNKSIRIGFWLISHIDGQTFNANGRPRIRSCRKGPLR